MFAVLMTCLLFYMTLPSNECLKYDWAKENNKTQGGVWNWYPGKSTSQDLYKATTLAKIESMRKFQNDCGNVLVKTLVFNETCVQRASPYDAPQYTVYVRLTAKKDACELSRELSKKKMTSNLKAIYVNEALVNLWTVAEDQGWLKKKARP